MSKISIHREVNSSIIPFDQESLINVFYGLIKKFNKEIDKSIIEVTKMELWALLGYNNKNYNPEEIKKIIKQLTKSGTYEIPENQSKISGSIFVIEELENTLKIEIPSTFRKYIFTQKDIDLIVKAKHNKKMKIEELDYWNNTLKNKKKDLVLLKEADIFNIKGKYAKRLYTLLAQNSLTRKYEKDLKGLREILEIPQSYKMGNIDQKVLNPAIKEIQLKTKIRNIKINKIKIGKVIDKIVFTFTEAKEHHIDNTENLNQAPLEESQELSQEQILKTSIRKALTKLGAYDRYQELTNLNTVEELEYYIKENNLSIEREVSR